MCRKAILLSNIVNDHQLIIETMNFMARNNWVVALRIKFLCNIDQSACIDDKIRGVKDPFC